MVEGNAPKARIAAGIAVEIAVNVAAPLVVYSYFDRSLGDVKALLASSAPPILWSIVEFARKRRVDALSLLVVAGIVLSLLAFLGGGSVKLLQLRENLVTGAIGLFFLGSAIVKKPLIYELARASMARQSASKVEAFEQLRDKAGFRRSMSVMTYVWGIGLLAQTALACVLVYALSIRDYLVVSPILGYAAFGALALWQALYIKHRRRQRKRLESATP